MHTMSVFKFVEQSDDMEHGVAIQITPKCLTYELVSAIVSRYEHGTCTALKVALHKS